MSSVLEGFKMINDSLRYNRESKLAWEKEKRDSEFKAAMLDRELNDPKRLHEADIHRRAMEVVPLTTGYNLGTMGTNERTVYNETVKPIIDVIGAEHGFYVGDDGKTYATDTNEPFKTNRWRTESIQADMQTAMMAGMSETARFDLDVRNTDRDVRNFEAAYGTNKKNMSQAKSIAYTQLKHKQELLHTKRDDPNSEFKRVRTDIRNLDNLLMDAIKNPHTNDKLVAQLTNMIKLKNGELETLGKVIGKQNASALTIPQQNTIIKRRTTVELALIAAKAEGKEQAAMLKMIEGSAGSDFESIKAYIESPTDEVTRAYQNELDNYNTRFGGASWYEAGRNKKPEVTTGGTDKPAAIGAPLTNELQSYVDSGLTTPQWVSAARKQGISDSDIGAMISDASSKGLPLPQFKGANAKEFTRKPQVEVASGKKVSPFSKDYADLITNEDKRSVLQGNGVTPATAKKIKERYNDLEQFKKNQERLDNLQARVGNPPKKKPKEKYTKSDLRKQAEKMAQGEAKTRVEEAMSKFDLTGKSKTQLDYVYRQIESLIAEQKKLAKKLNKKYY